MSSIATDPQPVTDGRGATILGPRNVAIDRQNPDLLVAPVTDAGTVPNLKWPFSLSHNRVLSGGFARETTTRELPIATEIAGVNMRLTPLFRSDHYADISLSQWMGVLPPELVQAHLNLDDATIARLPKTRPLITR